MRPVRIRPAVPGDAVHILRTHQASIAELCSGHYTPGQIEAWIGPRTADDYVKALEAARVYVAEEGSQLVGFAMVDVKAGIVLATYVHPDHVGRGVGSLLLGAVEAEAESSGLTKLWLNATLNSVPFYQARGYESLGPATNTLPGGVNLPCVRMEKKLQRSPAG